MSILATYLDDFIHLVFPHNCLSCNYALNESEHLICETCLHDLPTTGYWRFDDNPVAASFYGRVPVERACSFLFFTKGGRVQQMLHHLKYGNKPEVGVLLGMRFGEQLLNSAYSSIDTIIPVPLHAEKYKKRGYNQCDQIAEGIARAMNKSVQITLLERNKANESQTRKGRYERWQNVNDLFVVEQPHLLEGHRILLIDDVITTGSTLEACVRALRTVKNAQISIATIACPSVV